MLRPRGTTCRPILALVACAALLLTACSGDPREDSPGRDDSTTSPSESTSESASASAEPIDVDATDNLDPCTIVPRDTWLTFVPKNQRDTARAQQQLTELPLGATSRVGTFTNDDHPKYACVVTYGDAEAAVAWGWYLGPFTPQTVNKMFADVGGTEHDMGTYVAVTGGGFLTANAVGLTPYDTGFFIAVDAPVSSKSRLEKEPAEDGSGEVFAMDRRMLDVLDLIDERADTQPRVLLPEGCPAVDDPAIRSVMGKAKFARGSNDGEGQQFCLYRNPDRGAVLRLRGGTGTQDALEDLLDASASEGRAKDSFEGSSGAEGAAVTSTTGSATGTLVDLDELRYAFADVTPELLEGDAPPVPREAFIALLESFYASEPGGTTVE